MKQSKTLKVSAAALTVAALLAGCGSKDNSSGGSSDSSDSVTLSMTFAESLFAGVHEDLIKEFQSKHPTIKVKAETLPDGVIYDSLRTKISTGEMPDLYQINIGHVTTDMANKDGYIYDLSSLESSKNYADSIRKATTLDGKTALFSLGVGVMGFAYDKKAFADAGYAAPPKTWDELLDLGKKLKAKGKDLLVYSSKWETGIANVFHWTFGAKAAGDDAFKKAYLSNSLDFSKPENRALVEEGFKRFKELNQYVRTGSFTNEYSVAQQAFANGDAAMLMGGTWEAGALRKLAPNMDLGFMNLPYAAEDKNPYIFVPEDGIAINAKSKNVEAAKTFLNWLFSKDTYAKIQETKGTFSAQTGVGKLDESYTEVPKWLETNRVVSFANTGPIPSATWVALGNAAQEYTFKDDLNKAVDKFIAEYDKTKQK